MSNQNFIQFTCLRPECGYLNVWTRQEVLQKAQGIIFLGTKAKSKIYLVPCKNPKAPSCPEQRRIEIRDEERPS